MFTPKAKKYNGGKIYTCLDCFVLPVLCKHKGRADADVVHLNKMQSLHEHKVIRHSRKSIFGPMTSHVLLHLIQQQPKTLTSNFAKNAARINVLENNFLPHPQPARSKACTFFVSQRHGFPARQMNEIVSPVADYRDQTARTDCVDDTKKNCRKQRLDSASQCNSSAVSDLIVVEPHRC